MANYLDQISEFICECQFDRLPPQVIQRACDVTADTLAAIAAGAQENEVKDFTARILAAKSQGISTIIGSGEKTEPSKAALINGTAGTFLELDEGNQFGRGHPGIHVFPAILAKAEEKGLSGRDFITALVLGYEIGTRIGIASKLRMSMHPHGTWGTVGAAVAVGKLSGYDVAAMKEIINVSSSLGLATSRKTMLEGGTVRNVYAGVSGYMGILAHDLVQSGFIGEADGLQTVYGSVVSDSFDPDAMTEKLGVRFEIARNYFKRHACCRYNHGTLDALDEVISRRPDQKIMPQEVDRVEVKTYSLAAQLCDPSPQNMLAGKFSIPFAVATSIVHGSTGIHSFTPEAIQNPVARELAQRVSVVEDPQLTAMMPAHRPSKIKVILKDGSVLEAETLTNKGDAEDPYSSDDLRIKYFELAQRAWSRNIAEAVYQEAMNLPELNNIAQMTGRIRNAAS
ncbi:MAG: MmgE/PrpD family protein [Desulfobacterales bacterium]|nr:MAG: MmgE/PrpD family protein [Desulfobacterales bacterium]